MLDGELSAVVPGESGAPRPRPRPGPPDWAVRYRRHAVVSDMLCALLAGAAAVVARLGEGTASAAPRVIGTVAPPLVWVAWLALGGAYATGLFGSGPEEFRRIARCWGALCAAVALTAYAAGTAPARAHVLVALPLAGALTLAGRHVLRRRLRGRWARGDGWRCRVVAVGRPAQVARLREVLRRDPGQGVRLVAACLSSGGDADPGVVRAARVAGVPVLGDLTDVPLVVEQTGADAVAALACPELDGPALRRLAWRLERGRAGLLVAPALLDAAGPRTALRPVAGLSLLRAEHPELTGAGRLLKGAVDRVAAGLALAVLAPLLAALALAVRATSPGPALERRRRVGRDGAEFTLLRFRTTWREADRRRVELSGGRGDPVSIRRDPRVTPLGARLRRRSLDELPQLVNVLRGDLSLVGPRPPLPAEVEQYGDDVRRRLVVRPGMTGLWQLDRRPDLSWEESVRLDLRYVENWSLMLDLQILWKTWAAVARGTGAYRG
ncbi:exopolysaccharide biosynthesis polyprenyl glycosylphosphotransferase [Microbispora sp. ATCC PTA-5024]|uniref:exopolysaccharide biosynthesis polyprenyl glycosylphosphotransferase n=1 Tax=Microbispora sp. ATCC PTA-5024 TaxID=316330 RepID=UPI0003DCCAF8|nr:exopolysaccharide biosynthesis polyprenyl glycosylphosphotransferase [Microbispora sp. ATCC PTA-5024]ETK31034.1 UDP-phosphate galactose phosphotransferase [Microbispora sp. ATCC PTA-5024]